MQFSTSSQGDSVVLRIGGELDAVSVVELRSTLDKLVDEKHMKIVVDLSGLRLIDSSGVGSIVSLFRRVRAYGGTVELRGVQDQPLAIFRLLKLDRVLFAADMAV
jgi:anti-sigma B factor antagonist